MKAVKITALIILALIVILAAAFIRAPLSKEDLKAYWQAPSQFVELPSGTTTHYRDVGNPEGPTLLLVHGGLDTLHTWNHWVERLKQDHRVVTLDLIGHGLSGRSPTEIYSRASIVKYLHEFVTVMELDNFVIAGSSMGGGVATLYTLEHPDRVSGLILVGSGGVTDEVVSEGSDTSQEYFNIDKDAVAMPGGSYDLSTELSWSDQLATYVKVPSSLIEKTLAAMFVDDTAISQTLVDRWRDMLRYEGNRGVSTLLFRHYYAGTPKADLEPRFGEIKVPTLLLWGDGDVLVGPETAKRFDAGIPDSTLIMYEGAGHMPMEEIPERTASDVAHFVQLKIVNTPDN